MRHTDWFEWLTKRTVVFFSKIKKISFFYRRNSFSFNFLSFFYFKIKFDFSDKDKHYKMPIKTFNYSSYLQSSLKKIWFIFFYRFCCLTVTSTHMTMSLLMHFLYVSNINVFLQFFFSVNRPISDEIKVSFTKLLSSIFSHSF